MIGMVEQNRDWLPANRDYREELEAASALSDLDSQLVIPAQAGMTEYHEFFNVTNHPIRYSPAFFTCVSA